MWESRVLQRAFERLELHEGKLSRAVLRGGGGGDVTSLPDTWVGNHPGLPGPRLRNRSDPEATIADLSRFPNMSRFPNSGLVPLSSFRLVVASRASSADGLFLAYSCTGPWRKIDLG